MVGVASADEDGRDGGVTHRPRKGEADHRRLGALGLFAEELDDAEVAIGEVDVGVGGHDVIAGALWELGAVGVYLPVRKPAPRGL